MADLHEGPLLLGLTLGSLDTAGAYWGSGVSCGFLATIFLGILSYSKCESIAFLRFFHFLSMSDSSIISIGVNVFNADGISFFSK